MGIGTERFDNRVREKLNKMVDSSHRSYDAVINDLVASGLSAKGYNCETNQQIVTNVEQKFANYLNSKSQLQIIDSTSHDDRIILSKDAIPTKINTDKEGHFQVCLSDFSLTAYFRFESKDMKLRDELKKLIQNSNLRSIEVIEKTKFTAIGLWTRDRKAINEIDEDKLFNIITSIYDLLFY